MMFRSFLPLPIALLLTCSAVAEEEPHWKELQAIHAHASRFASFPSGWSGPPATAQIEFRLAPDGALVSQRVRQSSGYEIIDLAAMDAILRASPFPAPPPGHDGLFVVPFTFRQAEHKRLPDEAVTRIMQSMRNSPDIRGASGSVVLRFKLDHEGRILNSNILIGSCSEALDREVLAALERASPFPADVPRGVSYIVPVVFGGNQPNPRLDCQTPRQKDRERDRAIGLHPPE